MVLANAAGHDRTEMVKIDDGHSPAGEALTVAASDGPVQRCADGRLAFVANCRASALSSVALVSGGDTGAGAAATVEASGDEVVLENEHLRVRFAADGTIASIVERSAGREVLAGPGNLLQLHDDHPNQYDAWDIDAVHRRSVTDLLDVESIDTVESGPVVASVRVVRSFGASRVTQTHELAAGSPHLTIDTEIDWQESEKLLKAAFPLNVRSDEATYEIQFGHVARPTHQNTSWDAAQFEVCGHKWADLSEPGFGASLFNDSKYGHDCVGNTLRLTLLKSASYPDPHADQGVHRFRYAIRPHVGSFQDAGIVDEALAFNLPIRAIAGSVATEPFVSIGDPAVQVDAVKLADDGSGDVIVRCHEAHGRHVTTSVRVDRSAAAVATDLLERGNEAVDPSAVGFTPFQIRTLRYR